MRLLIVHLSDIHLRDSGINVIFERRDKISQAFQNLCHDANVLFLVITGDIAQAGKASEYEIAFEFVEGIKTSIESYTKKKLNVILIPGNHDCDFEYSKTSVRETLIQSIRNNTIRSIDNAFIEQCCEVQKNWFNFFGIYHDKGTSIFSDNLLNIYKYKFDDHSVYFDCYNTSWISQKQEEHGSMYFPIGFHSDEIFNRKAELTVSLLHHPFNWQDKDSIRGFRTHIEKTSDMILTGHEHTHDKWKKDDLSGNLTEYIEGAVLQDQADFKNSSFNVIQIDMTKKQQWISNYKWNGEIYTNTNPSDNWIPLKMEKVNAKQFFKINDDFKKFINDPGASFTHPNKTKIYLSDFFMFPDLRNLKSEMKKEKLAIEEPLSSSILFNDQKDANKVLLTGAEKIGKSTLCKMLFAHYFKNGYVPILVEGSAIISSSIDDFNKLINKNFIQIYSKESIENFKQLENEKKVLLIDDIDESRLNIKGKAKLFNELNSRYQNIIVAGNDLFQVEELICEERQDEPVFKNYQQYEIIEFGHLLRSKLIEKWYMIGQEHSIEDAELIRKHDLAKQIIDTIIGRNLVPSYPVFLLTILQTIEAGAKHDLKESAYGHYYQFLITQALGKLRKRHEELDAYYNYITELSYHFFKNKIKTDTKDNLHKFHKWFCSEYRISLGFEDFYRDLCKVDILESHDDVYKFKYKYVYYFFVAKYLSDNISTDEIKITISKLCKRIYREEYANIIMFLTHHSKDPFILDEILKNAQVVFSEFSPVKLEDDIDIFNRLLSDIPKLVLEDVDFRKHRQSQHKLQDNIERSKITNIDDTQDIIDDKQSISELDIVAKLNLAFKTIEIIGQLLKNYYGSLKGDRKLTLCEEAYLVGLRTLRSFFNLLEKDTEAIVSDIKIFIDKKELVEKDKIEETVRKILFHLCEIMSFGFIKKTASFLGSDKLSETFDEVLNKHNYTAVQLIDTSIKLDFFKAFPSNDIKKLKEKIANNFLSLTILKRMVINHLYMFPVDYKDKQKICNMLEIPMQTQRTIDIVSTQKKV